MDVLQPGDIIRVSRIEDDTWRLAQVPEAQSALVVLGPQDGAIKALIGGFSFLQSNYNRATQARRQPGSSFKPFLYCAALDKGYTPASLVNDAPLIFVDDYLDSIWRPKNSGGDFLGPIRLREALYRSRNLVSIRLMQDLGVDNALSYIERFGFERKELPRNLSASLGTSELTPLQIAQGYATFANGGYAVKPYLIDRIENRYGQLIDYSKPPVTPALTEQQQARLNAYVERQGSGISEQPAEAKRVVDERTIYQLNSMLRDVVRRGTAVRARALNRNDLAGKTGTTNDQKDAWFSGFNPDLVATVWVGFDQPSTLGRREFGGTAALPIWMNFMGAALEGVPDREPRMPRGLVTARIDPTTGRSAPPGTDGAFMEIFKQEDAPPPYSELEMGGYDSGGAVTPLELF